MKPIGFLSERSWFQFIYYLLSAIAILSSLHHFVFISRNQPEQLAQRWVSGHPQSSPMAIPKWDCSTSHSKRSGRRCSRWRLSQVPYLNTFTLNSAYLNLFRSSLVLPNYYRMHVHCAPKYVNPSILPFHDPATD